MAAPASSPSTRRRRVAAALAGLATAALVGAPALPATASGRPPQRSWIAFVSDRDSAAAGTSEEVLNDDVYLLDPRTGRTVRLTTDPGIDQVPLISADGRRLLFMSDRSTADFPNPAHDFAFYTCRLHLSARTPSCRHLHRVPGYVPLLVGARYALAPDGRSVVFSQGGDLFRLVLGRTDPVLLLPRRPDAVAGANQPDISPDGRWVAYNDDGNLWRVDIDGSGPTQLTPTTYRDPEQTVQVVNAAPDISPDGSRIAFHSNPSGPEFDVFVMRAEPQSARNRPRDLTAGLVAPPAPPAPGAPSLPSRPSQERFPTWSPDGRQIAFFWYAEPSASSGYDAGEIYRVDRDGSHLTDLTDNYRADLPIDDPRQIGDIQPDWGGRAH